MENEDEFGDLYTDALHPKSIPTPSPAPQNLHDNIPFESSSINPEEDADVDWLLGREFPHLEEPANWFDDDDEEVVVSRASRNVALGFPFKVGGAKVSAEKTAAIGDPDEEPVISVVSNGGLAKASGSEDWDSDSDDDLQIILNEAVRESRTERRWGRGSDEDDEDGNEDLVIVTDDDHHHHQVMEEQEWGDDAVQPSADREKKAMIEVVKANGGAATASGARIGYSNHGLYQQHHLSFKYARPDAAPTPRGSGIVAVGAPGQVRPPAFGLMAGRGRGDWSPVGGRGFPNLQKGFHPGFGLPAWGNSTSGRPFGGGLDFILPSHKLSQGTSYENSSTSEGSNDTLPSRSVHLDKHEGHHKEKAGDGMETSEARELSPFNTVEVTRELNMEPKDAQRDDTFTLGDSIEGDAEEASDFQLSSETVEDDELIHSAKRKMSNSCVEQLAAQDNGDGGDSKLTHSDNSLAKSVNSRDHEKGLESAEEVMHNFPLRRTLDFHKHHGEGERGRRDDYRWDDRGETEKNHAISKGRETMLQSYTHKDWDSDFEHTFWGMHERFEREVNDSIRAWQRRKDDAHSRQVMDENLRRERNNQRRSKEVIKIKVTKRNEKIENNIKKTVDGDWKWHNKKSVLRHTERDDILMNHRENQEGSQMKRRKREAELYWREKADIEDSLHGYRAREDSNRRKREREDIMDHSKRENDVRTKSKTEEHQSSNHKEDDWYRRDREDQQRLKLSYSVTFSSREGEERRLASRSGRPIEVKALARRGMCRDDLKVIGSNKDYHSKDRRWQMEQSKRADRMEEYDSLNKVHGGSHAREKRFSTEERSMRHERLSTLPDHPLGDFHGQQVQKEKHRDSIRKIKDAEHVGQSGGVYGKRKHEDRNTSGSGTKMRATQPT